MAVLAVDISQRFLESADPGILNEPSDDEADVMTDNDPPAKRQRRYDHKCGRPRRYVTYDATGEDD